MSENMTSGSSQEGMELLEVQHLLFEVLERVETELERLEIVDNVEHDDAAEGKDTETHGSQLFPSPCTPLPPNTFESALSPILETRPAEDPKQSVQVVLSQESPEEADSDEVFLNTLIYSIDVKIPSTCDEKDPERAVDDSESCSNFSSESQNDSPSNDSSSDSSDEEVKEGIVENEVGDVVNQEMSQEDDAQETAEDEMEKENAAGDIIRTSERRDPYSQDTDVPIHTPQWCSGDITPLKVPNFIEVPIKVGLSRNAKITSLHPYLRVNSMNDNKRDPAKLERKRKIED